MGLLGGFLVTIRQMGKKNRLTRLYAKDEGGKRDKPVRLHGRHQLNRYEDGMEKCIGCELCAGVCPARCIYVRGKDNPPDAPVSPGERYGFVYEINYLRCIHCDLCVEACPTEAITETKLFEFSFLNRADAIYTRDELLVDDEGLPQRMPWEDWTDFDAVVPHSSGWVRATAASGDATYQGRVGWSGELGFGVKPPEEGDDDRNTRADDRRRDRCGRGPPLMEAAVFAVCAVIVLMGALGVVLARNPVHSALCLVATLFGIAVLFIVQDANFLAAVQVIVYAGAIVVLFLFVIMLLGVDRSDDLDTEPLVAQRPLALIVGVVLGAGMVAVVIASTVTGLRGSSAALDPDVPDIEQIGRLLFTDYLFAFEITSVLLVIAVVGAVMLARAKPGDQLDDDEPVPGVAGADDEDEDEDVDA